MNTTITDLVLMIGFQLLILYIIALVFFSAQTPIDAVKSVSDVVGLFTGVKNSKTN